MGKAENEIEGYLSKKAKKYGFLCYKFVSPGKKGVPDRILLAKGYTIYIETKSNTGVLSEIQKIRINEMRKQGCEVYVINNRKSIDQLLENINARTQINNNQSLFKIT